MPSFRSISRSLSPKGGIKTQNFLGMALTTPAVIAFIGYIVLSLVIILPFEYPVVDESTGEEYIVKYDFATRVVILLLMAIPIALSIYSINCMMSGKCVLWSYAVSLISIYWVALFVITAVVYTFKKHR